MAGRSRATLLGRVAGEIAVRHLTRESIDTMNRQADRLGAALPARAAELGVEIATPGEGAAFALLSRRQRRGDQLGGDRAALPGRPEPRRLHGTHGKIALATVTTDAQVDRSVEALGAALADVAGASPPRRGRTLREEHIS